MARHCPGPIGVVAALEREAAALERVAAASDEILIEIPGPGPVSATAGARRLVERGVKLLVSWGTAGALGPAKAGDIVVPQVVLDANGQRFDAEPGAVESLREAMAGIAPLHSGALVSVDAPVAVVAEKQRLARETGAVAVEMESAGVAAAAARAGLPFAVLRVIVDAADQGVPEAAIAALDGPRVRLGPMFAVLVKSPRQFGGLLKLGRASGKAQRTLRECARRLGLLVGPG